ncbi:MAG: hypothetical protein K9L32_09975 [Chromatiaceae bacterium]|nr:hypothetical protein [Chromatiaceae bacterium]MCF8004515.1 hypothetical protein [Chromatiaceae bacterium]
MADTTGDDLRTEYRREDLGQGVRGKYYASYRESHNLVLLKPEVAEAFPSEEAVNEALLSLIRIAKSSINTSDQSLHGDLPK